jgi:hypothetical protein
MVKQHFSKGLVLSYVDEHKHGNFPFHLNSYMPFSGVYILNISMHCAELRTVLQNMSSIKCRNDQQRMKFLQCVVCHGMLCILQTVVHVFLPRNVWTCRLM